MLLQLNLKMKQIILILFFLSISKIYSQKIEKRIGDIHITREGYYFDNNQKSNKRKISKSEYYFNDKGQILETISYGTSHSNNLKLIGQIEQFFYVNDKLDLSKRYSTECNTCEFYLYYNKYKYDDSDNLISSNSYYGNNDSLFMPITYIYKPNITEKHFGESTYYEKKYDSINRIIELNQRFEDTKIIRWQHSYKYLGNSTVGIFQTYYHDKMDHTEFEIKTYDFEKKLISYEKIGLLKSKKEYTYSKEGFLTKIKEYRLNIDGNYELERLTKFKVHKKQKYLKPIYLQKIYSQLIEEE